MRKLRMHLNKNKLQLRPKSLNVTILLTYAYLDLASTKSGYSPIWRVQNLFGEYGVTRQFGEHEFFLMSNPVYHIHNLSIKHTTDLSF